MTKHMDHTEELLMRALEMLDRGLPTAEIAASFSANDRPVVMEFLSSVRMLVDEREAIVPPPEGLARIIVKISEYESMRESGTARHAVRAFISGLNPVVRFGVPISVFAVAILLAVIPGKRSTDTAGSGTVQTDSGQVAMVSSPTAATLKSGAAAVSAPAPAESSDPVDGIVNSLIAEAASDQAVFQDETSHISLVGYDAAAATELGQFYNTNGL
jgi:hypothetical protein